MTNTGLEWRFWLAAVADTDDRPAVRAIASDVLAELDELKRVRDELVALIDRHTQPDPQIPGRMAEYQVAVAELRNILEPGSAPMYAEDWPAFTATCGICLPQGDGIHFHRGKSGARRPE